MASDPRNPVNSDEMIRRARSDAEGERSDDFQLPSFSAMRQEAEAAAQLRSEEQALRKAEEAQRTADEARRATAGLGAPAATVDTRSPGSSTTATDPDPDAADRDAYGPITGVGYPATAPSEEQETDQPRTWRLSLGWLRWVIAGVVAIFLISRFFDPSTSVTDLSVGDCFDDPGGNEIYSVKLLECDDWHDFEVYALVQLDGDNGSFPGDDALFEELAEACLTRFEGYVGHEYATSQYDFSGLTPLADGWREGDREGVCLVHRWLDEDVLRKSASARGAGI